MPPLTREELKKMMAERDQEQAANFGTVMESVLSRVIPKPPDKEPPKDDTFVRKDEIGELIKQGVVDALTALKGEEKPKGFFGLF